MARIHSLENRCREILEYMWMKRQERIQYAKELAYGEEEQKTKFMIPFLEVELDMHHEVRTVWPYVLAIPEEPVVKEICEIYETDVQSLGAVIDRKIQDLNRLLEVIETRLTSIPAQNSFWAVIHEEILNRLTREAKAILGRE